MGWHLTTRQDVWAGLLFIAIACFGLWLGSAYPMGTSVRMGAGYFPRMLCLLLLAIGVFVCVRGLLTPGAAITPPNWRVALIPAAVALFAMLLRDGGLVLAVAGATLVASLASPAIKLKEVLLMAAVLALLATAVFVEGIGLLIPILPSL